MDVKFIKGDLNNKKIAIKTTDEAVIMQDGRTLAETMIELSGGIQEVTREELISLASESKLVPGKQYKIIDYVTRANSENERSLEIPLDIVLTAITESIVSEDGYAIPKNEGQTDYICLECKFDINKNLITKMVDKNQNEASFDFYNLQFKNSQNEYQCVFGKNSNNNKVFSRGCFIGDNSNNNVINEGCAGITIDNNCNNVLFDGNIKNISLINANNTCVLSNIIVHSCFSQNEELLEISITKTNDDYILEIAKDSQGNIIKYCLADLLSTAIYTEVEAERIFIDGPSIINKDTKYSLSAYPLRGTIPSGITFEIEENTYGASITEDGLVEI